jgi:hypothetical protein
MPLFVQITIETADQVTDALHEGGRLHGDLKVIKTLDGDKYLFIQSVLFP